MVDSGPLLVSNGSSLADGLKRSIMGFHILCTSSHLSYASLWFVQGIFTFITRVRDSWSRHNSFCSCSDVPCRLLKLVCAPRNSMADDSLFHDGFWIRGCLHDYSLSREDHVTFLVPYKFYTTLSFTTVQCDMIVQVVSHISLWREILDLHFYLLKSGQRQWILF